VNLSMMASIFIFAVLLFLITGTSLKTTERKKEISSRLSKYTRVAQEDSSITADLLAEKKKEALRHFFSSFSRTLTPRGWRNKAEAALSQVDLPLRPEEYVFLQMALILAAGLLVYYLSGRNILPSGLAAAAAAIFPSLFLHHARGKRIRAFENQLVEGLTIMANSLRAGFSFLQAADTLAKEMPPPLSKEFGRLLREMNLGVTTEEALDHLLARVQSADFDLVVTAVKINRQVGGNLAEVLDTIGETINQRIKLQGKLRTLTAQGRISGYIIGMLPVAIVAFVFAVNPAYMMALFIHPLGLIMVGWAALSEMIGFLLIKKIVSIDY
jgi:tight adherence protein B